MTNPYHLNPKPISIAPETSKKARSALESSKNLSTWQLGSRLGHHGISERSRPAELIVSGSLHMSQSPSRINRAWAIGQHCRRARGAVLHYGTVKRIAPCARVWHLCQIDTLLGITTTQRGCKLKQHRLPSARWDDSCYETRTVHLDSIQGSMMARNAVKVASATIKTTKVCIEGCSPI